MAESELWVGNAEIKKWSQVPSKQGGSLQLQQITFELLNMSKWNTGVHFAKRSFSVSQRSMISLSSPVSISQGCSPSGSISFVIIVKVGVISNP